MSYRVYMEGHILRIDLIEDFALADFREMVAELEAIETALQHAPDRIVDSLQMTDTILDYPLLSSLVRERVQRRPPNRYRMAVVAGSPLGYGLGRMYEMLAKHANFDVHLTNTIEEARQILAASPADPQQPNADEE